MSVQMSARMGTLWCVFPHDLSLSKIARMTRRKPSDVGIAFVTMVGKPEMKRARMILSAHVGRDVEEAEVALSAATAAEVQRWEEQQDFTRRYRAKPKPVEQPSLF